MNNMSHDHPEINDMPLNEMLNVHKENNLELTCGIIEDNENFKNVKISEVVSEQNASVDTINAKQIMQNNDDIPLIKAVIPAVLAKKKKCLISSNDFNISEKIAECKTKSSDDKSATHIETPNDNIEFYLTCCLCRKGFETPENFTDHDCNHDCKKSNSDLKMYTCKFCSLTFTRKCHLNKHIKGHKRNNCTICNTQFAKHEDFCKHLKNEHNIDPEKLYNCSFCNECFSNKQSLNIHKKSHDTNQFVCDACHFNCGSEDNYNSHVKQCIKILKHECHLCEKKFASLQQYKKHISAHKKHLCSSCNITFATKKLFKKHQQSVHCNSVKEKHECSICNKSFLRPKQLLLHQSVHTGEKPVKCFHCEKSFCNAKNLSKHMKSLRHLQRVNSNEGKVIEIEKPFACSECGAKFYQQQSLYRHIEFVHSDSEYVKCPHCEYSTKIKTNLKRHVELHTDIKRFICEICGSSFRAFATLKEHYAFVHSENRKFICEICNKGFKNKSDLQRHLKIHSKSRPYKCHCNKDFKRMSHLKRHMTYVHQVTFKKHLMEIAEIPNLDIYSNDNTVSTLSGSVEELSESSCDFFSVSPVSNVSAECTELNDSGANKNASEKDQNDFFLVSLASNVSADCPKVNDSDVNKNTSEKDHNDFFSVSLISNVSAECTGLNDSDANKNASEKDQNDFFSVSLISNVSAECTELNDSDANKNASEKDQNDFFSVSLVSNVSAECTELKDSDVNKNSSEKDQNCIDVPSNAMQTFLNKRNDHIITDDLKNTFISFNSVACLDTSMNILSDSQISASLDDPNLNLSPNNYCNFSLPSSPLSSIPIEGMSSALQHPVTFQDVLSFSSSVDSLSRPLSLPNLNFQTQASGIDTYVNFSLHSSDLSSPQSPSFSLTDNVSSPLHIRDLNLNQNSSPKPFFEESNGILSLSPYTSGSELGEVNCSSEHFFNSTKNIELWDTSDNSNRLKISDNDLAITNFSTNLSCNANIFAL